MPDERAHHRAAAVPPKDTTPEGDARPPDPDPERVPDAADETTAEAAEEAEEAAAEPTRRGSHPPLDVVLEMTKGEGPIAGSARALGIALLASMGLVLAGLIALVIWGLTAIF